MPCVRVNVCNESDDPGGLPMLCLLRKSQYAYSNAGLRRYSCLVHNNVDSYYRTPEFSRFCLYIVYVPLELCIIC